MLVGGEEGDRPTIDLVFDVVRLLELCDQSFTDVIADFQIFRDVFEQLIRFVFIFEGEARFITSQFQLTRSAFVGAGLMFAGITDTCGMAMVLAKMPWNQIKGTVRNCSVN